MKNKNVTIVIPVYGDWPSLKQCIASLKRHVNTQLHRVLLVNDCGPNVDAIERNVKHSIKGLDGFEYKRNPQNLGFVGTCNRAVLELDTSDNDILLLNSDTEVTAGFLNEMRRVLYASKNIGAVSPRTNNATIATIPLSAAINRQMTDPATSYELFREMRAKLPRYNVVPTAHGFCMLVRRDLIKKYGLFDDIFGKGYGEEVDFCMRIREHGYLSALSNHAFVFHLEARSFTLETKNQLVQQNDKILKMRHPQYHQLVGEYIEQALLREEGIRPEKKPRPRPSLRALAKGILRRIHRLTRL